MTSKIALHYVNENIKNEKFHNIFDSHRLKFYMTNLPNEYIKIYNFTIDTDFEFKV